MTLKAHSVAAIATAMQPLLGPETAVVTAMNGVPWWYFYKLAGPHEGYRIRSIDPDGTLWRLIPGERCLGCVVYPAAEVVAPGVVEHYYGNRFMLGEPDGSKSARATRLSGALTRAGFKAPVRPRIRDDIWVKLWGNLSFNPVSALTSGTLAGIANDPGTRAVIRRMMGEAGAVGTALGVKFGVDIETRIGWAADIGEHRTSMLQDLELGRPMEIDALVSAVAEMGDLVGVDPFIDAVLALASSGRGWPGVTQSKRVVRRACVHQDQRWTRETEHCVERLCPVRPTNGVPFAIRGTTLRMGRTIAGRSEMIDGPHPSGEVLPQSFLLWKEETHLRQFCSLSRARPGAHIRRPDSSAGGQQGFCRRGPPALTP